MSTFSQNAVLMFGEAVKISTPFQYRELKKYNDIPELLPLREKAAPVITALKGLVMYSNQLVALSNAQMSDADRNARLADYIAQARQRALDRNSIEALGITFGGQDSVLANMRSAPTFLEGIDAAAPLVDAIVFALTNRHVVTKGIGVCRSSEMKAQVRGDFGIDTFGAGADTGKSVEKDYKSPFEFMSQIDQVLIE